MKKFGIDISKWQKGIDINRCKAEGVEFVILRGAYSTSKDVCFDDFYSKCKAAGLPVGVYHYSMARTVEQAKAEAKLMLEILDGKKFEYPIYLDVEDNVQKELGKDLLTSIIITYCDILKDAGYYVGIYSTYLFLRDYTHVNKLWTYTKWIAQWNTKCTCPIPNDMWQFGGETNVIRSNKLAGYTVDMNYCYKDFTAEIRQKGLNGFNKPKSLARVAQEVIAGKWGNGEDRKKRLIAYGYSYEKVQAKVNELLNVPAKKSVEDVAREVIAGKWGNGYERKNRLKKAGYDYNEVQSKVNELMK